MPKSEKKRAKSYLRSYSFYLAQLFFTFGGTSAERVKVKPSEYQLLARQFARGGGETLVYAILGMMEELGEFVGKLLV